MTYTNVTDVAAELGGADITASSTPSSSQVDEWITEAAAEIDELTGQMWSSNTVTSSDYEYHDYDGNGIIRLANAPVISVESVEYDSEGIGAASTAWSTLTEGRTSSDDFILYKDEGILKVHKTNKTRKLSSGFQNIRITYTYGRSTVPTHIKRFATLLVAKRYIMSVANKTASTEGGAVSVGTISVDDPNNYVHNHFDKITNEIEYLRKRIIGSFKPYIYDTRAYE